MAISELTVPALTIELARYMGDLIATGTATGGDANTIIDTVNLTHATDNDLKGYWVGVYSGNGLGNERNISSSSASADSIDGDSNFSATINTSTKYIITKQWRPQQYLDAIASAVRRVQKVHLIPLDDVDGNIHELITTNDILCTDSNGNGQMEVWSNGTTSAPDGWTLDGNSSIARDGDTNDVRRGKYAATFTTDGSNLGQLTQDIVHFERYANKTVTLKAWHKSNAASRSLIRVGDGVTSSTTAQAKGANIWEEIELEFTLSEDPTQLQIDLEVTSGGAVVATWDDVRLISDGVALYSYDLPSRLAYLLNVREAVGSGAFGNQSETSYHMPLPPRSYFIERGSNPTLNFNNAFYKPANDRKVRLSGQAYPVSITSATAATAWTETVELNPEYVKAYARWYLLNSLLPEEFTDQWRLAIREARSDYQDAEKALGSRPMAGAKAVQVL